VHRRHALHITVVLSKAAHSGPSVCLRARAPCPLRVSRPGADRAERAAQAAGVSVQCKLQVLALPCPLGSRHGGGRRRWRAHQLTVTTGGQIVSSSDEE
jgi:hypothetical protein